LKILKEDALIFAIFKTILIKKAEGDVCDVTFRFLFFSLSLPRWAGTTDKKVLRY